MKQKKVYQCDKEGFFVGVTLADESPLEPGVFLIPQGCVEVEPKNTTAVWKWKDEKWVKAERKLVEPISKIEALQFEIYELREITRDAMERLNAAEDMLDILRNIEAKKG